MNKKTNLILIIIPLFFALIQTNFLRNSYELVNLNHQERIINAEGFCKKRGIGYINFIKKKYSKFKVIYGGSVNPKNINELKSVNNIDGFLIGGASQDPKKFIDIIKKTYN